MEMNIEAWIITQYREGKSTYEICETLNKNDSTKIKWYPNKINRLLKKARVKIRSRSRAQKLNLKSGRTKHPTKGTHRDAATKLKISKAISDKYQADPEARLKRSTQSKEKYEKMTPEEKEALRSKAAKALRAAAAEGSHVEKYIANELRQMGFTLTMHSKSIIPNADLHVDIFVNELQTCIEVDGLSHVEPVWGPEALEKTQKSDSIKNGLILSHYNLIRLEAFARKFTFAYGRRTWDRLRPAIEMLKEKNGCVLPFEQRFIYIKEDENNG